MIIPLIDINEFGNIKTLYTDDINLYELGKIHHVQRVSDILFCDTSQKWQVICIKTKKILYENKNRQECIDWEIKNLGHGGRFDIFKK